MQQFQKLGVAKFGWLQSATDERVQKRKAAMETVEGQKEHFERLAQENEHRAAQAVQSLKLARKQFEAEMASMRTRIADLEGKSTCCTFHEAILTLL